MAYLTALATSPGADCHVPRPTDGISLPLLSLNEVVGILVSYCYGTRRKVIADIKTIPARDKPDGTFAH